jgi:thioredoxin 1
MRRVLLAFALSALLFGPALAAETVPFRQPAFAQAQAAGKPILVEIDAGWCPTCAQQRPILAKLSADPAFRDLVIMKVDFDSQKPVVRAMHATMQSTLIAFHGAAERGRATGITDEAAIRALLEKTAS